MKTEKGGAGRPRPAVLPMPPLSIASGCLRVAPAINHPVRPPTDQLSTSYAMRLLVTGATGFIGRTLVLRALGDGRIGEVIAPVRSAEKLRAQLAREGVVNPPKLTILEADAPG